MGRYNPKHDRGRNESYGHTNHRNDREKKSFNPLFAVRVSAGLRMAVPHEILKQLGLNPDYVKQNRRGDTLIPLKVSPETGLVLNPGIRPNYWLLASKEYRRGNFAQIVAGENGQKLRGGLGRDGEVYFSVNQTRVLYLIQAHEGKDYVVIRRYKLLKNEKGDQNYLDMAQVFPTVNHENNEFANAFHLTMPSMLLETVKGHLPEEIKFLAEAVTAALEKVHADEDYPAYAELQEREPKQESEQKSEEIPLKEEKTKEIKEEPKKEEAFQKPKDEAAKDRKISREKDLRKEDEQEVESLTQKDDEKMFLSQSDVDKAELKKIQEEAKEFKNTVLSDALKGLEKTEKPVDKKSTTRKKSTAKK